MLYPVGVQFPLLPFDLPGFQQLGRRLAAIRERERQIAPLKEVSVDPLPGRGPLPGCDVCRIDRSGGDRAKPHHARRTQNPEALAQLDRMGNAPT